MMRHTFEIDVSGLYKSHYDIGIADQMLLQVILEIANEANKSGLDGERLINLCLDRYPDYGMVSRYEIIFETESDGQVVANRSLSSGE